MKLNLLTFLAVPVAVTAADGSSWMPKLFGAEQLGVEVEAHCQGCQPDYCYSPTSPDYACYKKGFPKCCTKTKGNCPNNNQPGCECEGNCNGVPDCTYYGVDNDTCGGSQFCRLDNGQCNLNIYGIDGYCQDSPVACTSESQPVCGCDGQTYGNSCAAAANGVNIAKTGSC